MIQAKWIGIGLAAASVVGVSYAAGYDRASDKYQAMLAQVQKEAQRREQVYADMAAEWERERSDIVTRLRERDDVESIEWADDPLPAGERERLYEAVCRISADSCGSADRM